MTSWPPQVRDVASAWIRVVLVFTAWGWASGCERREPSTRDEFQRLTRQGRSYLDSGDAPKAVEALRAAVALQPTHPDAHQNLAIALLRANDAVGAAAEARELIRLNQNPSAAHYLLGAALLRQGNAADAVAELQTSKDFDRAVNPVSYLLGRAQEQSGNLEAAAALYEEVVRFDTNHPAAYYNLGQVLNRLGRVQEAGQALEHHRDILTRRGGASVDQTTVEACVYTEIHLPFRLDQPESRGVPVTFRDATAEILGNPSNRFSGPFGVIDLRHDGTNDLFVREGDAQFRLLLRAGNRLEPASTVVSLASGNTFRRILVGDLDKDRHEDIVVLGEKGLHVIHVATNGLMSDVTEAANLREQGASEGLLADLNFTGNLDLVLLTPTNQSLRVLRNLGPMQFTNATPTSGFPLDLHGVTGLVSDDWNGDELNDFILGRTGQPPLLFERARGGPFAPAAVAEAWPAGGIFAIADFNNDLRNDLVVAESGRLAIVYSGFSQRLSLPTGTEDIRRWTLLDYDNDGWLDLMATTARGLRAWRNLGNAGFSETTRALGLAAATFPAITDVAAVDMDNDGDSDLVLAMEGAGLRILYNQGGNANRQLQLRLVGTRSNASALGLRIELTSGNWRSQRTVHALPIEIGVGNRESVETLNVRWSDALSTDIDIPVVPGRQRTLVEIVRPTGSCPYLYRWDGQRYTFVTDLLGGSPVGLPVAEGRYIEADTDEIVEVGTSADFMPRDGHFGLQITEELRELLYLDQAQLLVVDHAEGTEVHPADKLVPGRPFPPSNLVTVENRIPLRRAMDLEGGDVTGALQENDHVRVSPRQLRPPQQRGYAEPHGVVLDFGTLPVERPLVLALTGWLRFGGGMANMSASRDPGVAFPFPRLEVETGSTWRPVEVVVGAPCGKTKTILVDLAGKLPAGAGRLRLTAAFEIHWDRAALFERAGDEGPLATVLTRLAPDRTDLHWRGYSEFKDLPWTEPLTPDYERTRAWPDWRITPSGWCTRYGPVDELLAARDGGLLILNGGDELTLEFAASRLPAKRPGRQRKFFLFTVGWDKDADFHVIAGDKVGPLPWEGMDDQKYGIEIRPPHPGDGLNRRYTTRWVSPGARVHAGKARAQ